MGPSQIVDLQNIMRRTLTPSLLRALSRQLEGEADPEQQGVPEGALVTCRFYRVLVDTWPTYFGATLK